MMSYAIGGLLLGIVIGFVLGALAQSASNYREACERLLELNQREEPRDD